MEHIHKILEMAAIINENVEVSYKLTNYGDSYGLHIDKIEIDFGPFGTDSNLKLTVYPDVYIGEVPIQYCDTEINEKISLYTISVLSDIGGVINASIEDCKNA